MRVSGYFTIQGSTAGFYKIFILPEEVIPFLTAWRDCPEVVMSERFDWWPEVKIANKIRDFSTKRKDHVYLSLEDLEDLL